MHGVRPPAGGGGRARRDAPFVANPARRHPRAGLAAVGVALVASAARGLTAGTCKLRVTMAINAAAAVITFYYPATYMFPACILAGEKQRAGVGPRPTAHVQHGGHLDIIGTLTKPPCSHRLAE